MAMVFALYAQAQTPAATTPAAPPPGSQMLLTSTAFEDGGVVPPKHVGGATAASPALSWSQVPPGTQSFVLLMHDMEPVQNKSAKMDVTHWLAWNIPGTSTGLAEGVPAGALPDGTQQISIRSNGYWGPGAPPGKYHHYTFELYALDTKLNLQAGDPAKVVDTRLAVFDAMDGHVLGKAVLVSRFHR
jgi:Raf kinase inhibitor-like YbhB/YbcL family protein